MGNISLPVTHVAQWANTLHWGWNLSICRGGTSKVPKQGTWSLGGPPKSAPCHLLCVSLTFCLSYMNVFSPRLPSPLTLSSSCPSFLASGEVTFINGEFMCMTAPKPELCLDHPWRLSVNSCNHQSAKYLPFRAHQPLMRWLGVIYRIKSIIGSADLHWYWYGVIFSWLCLHETGGFTLQISDVEILHCPVRFFSNTDQPKQACVDDFFRWISFHENVGRKQNLKKKSRTKDKKSYGLRWIISYRY